MIERGMIFNAEMVRAILDGNKTQTRRIMAIQPEHSGLGLRRVIDSKDGRDNGKYFWSQSDACGMKARSKVFGCPHGAVGDRLWVRETWSEAGAGAPDLTLYRANYPEHVPSLYENIPATGDVRWRPSIHMPRWASRILLEIIDVRVERLNDISDEDANAEGVTASEFGPSRYEFGYLWQSIYGADNSQSWQANPWVWVIEFRRIEGGSSNGLGE